MQRMSDKQEIEHSEPLALAAVDSFELLRVCLAYLSLPDIIRISSCSKGLSDLIKYELSVGRRIVARGLLQDLVKSAVAAPAADSRTLVHGYSLCRAIQWLLDTAKITQEVLALDSSQYVRIPSMPLGLCEQLVLAGVRANYDLLVSAARDRIQGLQNWVIAQRNLKLDGGLSALVEALFCNNYSSLEGRGWSEVNPDNAYDLVCIALNSYGTATADDPTGTVLLPVLCRQAAVLQLPPEPVSKLLMSAVHLSKSGRASDTCSRGRPSIVRWICCLPGAYSVSTEDLEPILRVALQQGCHRRAADGDGLFEFRSLDDDLNCSSIHTQRLAPLQRWCTASMLMQLPGMQQLPLATVRELLRFTTKECNKIQAHDKAAVAVVFNFINQLCSVPAAKAISAYELYQLLQMYGGFGNKVCSWVNSRNSIGSWDVTVCEQLRELPAVVDA